jgi:hypothetical protein
VVIKRLTTGTLSVVRKAIGRLGLSEAEIKELRTRDVLWI